MRTSILNKHGELKTFQYLFTTVGHHLSSVSIWGKQSGRFFSEKNGFICSCLSWLTQDDDSEQRKSRFSEDAAIPQPGQPSPGQLTAIQIKEMMANAQRMIEERKRALGVSFPFLRSFVMWRNWQIQINWRVYKASVIFLVKLVWWAFELSNTNCLVLGDPD